MDECRECGRGRLETVVKREHTEDLGGVVVTVRNAVTVARCPECGEEITEIPDLEGLVKAAALVRALIPVQLGAKDILFMRRAFDMTQREFAEAVGLDSAETISRWENGVRGIGGSTEKLVRHSVAALLHKDAPAIDYDPSMIVAMKIRPNIDPPPLVFERIVLKHDHQREESWDAEFKIAA